MIFYVTLKKRDLNSPDLMLKYTPRDNLVANKYFKLIKDYIDRGIPVDQKLSYWNIILKREQKEELIRDLQLHCNFVNQQDQIDMAYSIDYSIDQVLLNEIHGKFEHYLKALHAREIVVTDEPEVHSSLLQINLIVHKIENFHAIEKQIQERGHNGVDANFGFRFENDIIYELKNHDYDHFTEERPFGSMNCGYNTTGKNLQHCMHNNDLEIVRNQAVSPQKTFSTEAFFWFGNSIDGEQSSKLFFEWWDTNNISQYGYKKYDRKNSIGMIPLADLVMPREFQDKDHWGRLKILNLYCGLEKVTYEV